MSKKNLIIIGGGAAGFFCAVNAARIHKNLTVTIIEKSGKLLSKVKISGGGRCNLTHACFSIPEMVKNYPRGANFLKKAFHHFFTTDTINWFEERGVKLKVEKDGRMFPASNNSQEIVNALLDEAAKYNVRIHTNTPVDSIREGSGGWIVPAGIETIFADYVCVATGGFSKNASLNLIKDTKHTIVQPVPSLFTFNCPQSPITSLMGISVSNAEVKIKGTKLSQLGDILITHWGLSGPAVLKLSAFGARHLHQENYQFAATINWVPAFNETAMVTKLALLKRELAVQKIKNRNTFLLPQRLWDFALGQCGIDNELRWADVASKHLNKLAKTLCAFELAISGKTTFKEEFVTAGGIDTSEIDANTMQSKLHKGLFFAGEALDVDGITGGFNFQHAWTSGWLAAANIS